MGEFDFDPEKKEQLRKRYDEAHKIAKKFLQGNPEADSKSVYSAADLAVKLYDESKAITSLSKFVQLKIQSVLRTNDKKKKKPRISSEIKQQIIEAKQKDKNLTNAKLAKMFNIAQSTICRTLKKARADGFTSVEEPASIVENEPIPAETNGSFCEGGIFSEILNVMNTATNSTDTKRISMTHETVNYNYYFSVERKE